MSSRLELHETLVELLGSRNVYFQPPSTVKIKYPCIIYFRDDIDTQFANNTLYNFTNVYMITVIDSNPDSEIPTKVIHLPYCRFDRHYTADNLNHDVFVLYH